MNSSILVGYKLVEMLKDAIPCDKCNHVCICLVCRRNGKEVRSWREKKICDPHSCGVNTLKGIKCTEFVSKRKPYEINPCR